MYLHESRVNIIEKLGMLAHELTEANRHPLFITLGDDDEVDGKLADDLADRPEGIQLDHLRAFRVRRATADNHFLEGRVLHDARLERRGDPRVGLRDRHRVVHPINEKCLLGAFVALRVDDGIARLPPFGHRDFVDARLLTPKLLEEALNHLRAQRVFLSCGDIHVCFQRLVLVYQYPVFVFAFYLPGFYGDVIPFALFVIASFTDFLDGLLARMYKEESKLGELLDPIADKIIVATALILLVMNGTIKNYEVIAAIIILTREILISGLREFLAKGKIGWFTLLTFSCGFSYSKWTLEKFILGQRLPSITKQLRTYGLDLPFNRNQESEAD